MDTIQFVKQLSNNDIQLIQGNTPFILKNHGLRLVRGQPSLPPPPTFTPYVCISFALGDIVYNG